MMNRVRIEIADNGYVVEYDDPDLEAKNSTSGPFVDPERRVVFPDQDSLKEGLSDILDKAGKAAESEAMEKARDFSGGFEITAKSS